MTITKRFILIFGILTTCISCDQTTKSVAQSLLSTTEAWSFLGGTIRFQLAHNPGAFLSLGASLPDVWRQALFSVAVVGLLLALLGYALFAKSASAFVVLAFALLVAGGLGNTIDRLIYDGYVIDFINIGIGSLRTGIFNVADIAVTTGMLMLVVNELHQKHKSV